MSELVKSFVSSRCILAPEYLIFRSLRHSTLLCRLTNLHVRLQVKELIPSTVDKVDEGYVDEIDGTTTGTRREGIQLLLYFLL